MANKSERLQSFSAIEKYIEDIKTLAEEVMASAFPESPSWNIETCCLHALCNVTITPQEVILTADLPNIDTKTVNIKTTDKNLIQITAKLKKKVRFVDLGIYHRRGEFSFLRCQGYVHVAFNPEKMRISNEMGILEVRFPRNL